jgi:hypothetical protein
MRIFRMQSPRRSILYSNRLYGKYGSGKNVEPEKTVERRNERVPVLELRPNIKIE